MLTYFLLTSNELSDKLKNIDFNQDFSVFLTIRYFCIEIVITIKKIFIMWEFLKITS